MRFLVLSNVFHFILDFFFLICRRLTPSLYVFPAPQISDFHRGATFIGFDSKIIGQASFPALQSSFGFFFKNAEKLWKSRPNP